MIKHWLTYTLNWDSEKVLGPVEELTPSLLMSGRELCHCTIRDHSGPKGNLHHHLITISDVASDQHYTILEIFEDGL